MSSDVAEPIFTSDFVLSPFVLPSTSLSLAIGWGPFPGYIQCQFEKCSFILEKKNSFVTIEFFEDDNFAFFLGSFLFAYINYMCNNGLHYIFFNIMSFDDIRLHYPLLSSPHPHWSPSFSQLTPLLLFMTFWGRGGMT